MLGIISALGSIASLASKLVAFVSALITRKDQIELGQDRQRQADQTAVDQARARMDKAAAEPVKPAEDMRDGTF